MYLSHKGRKFFVLEVLRQNFGLKLGQIMDDEAISILAPADDGT